MFTNDSTNNKDQVAGKVSVLELPEKSEKNQGTHNF